MPESPSSDVGTRTKEYISGKHSGEQLANTSPRVGKEKARESESKRAKQRAEGDMRKGARYGKTNVGRGGGTEER